MQVDAKLTTAATAKTVVNDLPKEATILKIFEYFEYIFMKFRTILKLKGCSVNNPFRDSDFPNSLINSRCFPLMHIILGSFVTNLLFYCSARVSFDKGLLRLFQTYRVVTTKWKRKFNMLVSSCTSQFLNIAETKLRERSNIER
jgi:hypothetical protein